MPCFAANLSMLYPEHEFIDRFAAAAKDGFEAVEYLFPYAFPRTKLASRLAENGLRQVLFNAPPGDWLAGERGLACLPGRQAEFRSGIENALDYAVALRCPRVHVMAGIAPEGVERARLLDCYEANLSWAARRAAGADVEILIEPINPVDMPGYFLSRQDEAHRIVRSVGAGNLKVQMDLYHCAMVEGDVAARLRQYLPTGRVGHLQIAGAPGRNEPDTGDLDYRQLFALIDDLSTHCGWDGWVGCEYRPARGAEAGGTSDGLGWRRSLMPAQSLR